MIYTRPVNGEGQVCGEPFQLQQSFGTIDSEERTPSGKLAPDAAIWQ